MIVKPAVPADAEQFTEWVTATDNGFDPNIANYTSLLTFKVEDEEGPALYIPVHPVLMIESVALRPNLSARKYVEALLAAKATTENIARAVGINEVHTSSTFKPMQKILVRHGYKPIAGAFHKRVGEL